MSGPRPLLDLSLAAIEPIATDISVFEFRRPDGGTLPAAAPGSHIALHLPRGYVRAYSVLEPGAAPLAYRIAVKREAGGRGGSGWLHEAAREGFRFLVGAPECGFPLAEEARVSVFIAGGIGIAPIKGMVGRLSEIGRDWRLHYAARTRSAAAFADALTGVGTSLYVDDATLDVDRVVRDAPADAYLYCCGPRTMMQAFERATACRDPDRVRREYFFPAAEPRLGGFRAELARSGRSVTVAPGQTLLDALLAAGVSVPYACLEGICGRCEVVVLDGTPEHHDTWLPPERRASGRTMLACCSGAAGERIVLAL